MAGIEELLELTETSKPKIVDGNKLRVYRGYEKMPLNKRSIFNKTIDRGKYFTENLDDAKWYAQRQKTLKGKVTYLDLIKEKFDKAKKLSKSRAVRLGGEVIVDDDLLKKQKTDILRTIAARAGNLSNLALKGLSFVASLPAQVVVMTLAPTDANADEVNMQLEDFAKLAEEAQPKKEMMSEGGFTGSDLYFQDKFNEFDFWSRYNNMRPKEGFAQMWKDYKDSTKMEEDEWGKPPPIPLSVLKSGLGFIVKQLASGKFNQGKRDFLEKIVKPPKSKPKVEKIEPYKFPSDKQIKKDLDKIFAEIYSKHSTKHAEGGIAGMLGEPRSGYQGGGGAGYEEYWKMVRESFYSPEVGGKEKTGLDIHEFADIYFPRKAEGGRIGYAKGNGVTKKFSMEAARLHFLKKLKDIYEKEWLEDWNPKDPTYHAEGGRIGFGEGDTPSEAYLRDIFMSIPGGDQLGTMSFEEWKSSASGQHYKDKWISEHRPKFDNGGPINLQALIELYMSEGMTHDEAVAAANKPLPFHILTDDKAEGGRIGFQDGRGIMSRVGDMVDARNVPYYGGKALQGLVNSAETLSKLPFAAGELGSKLIQQPPKKEMFMKAIEDITPGSWSENLGLTSLIEGMAEKRPEDAQTVGGILGLGTEIAVPTGGAFKAGQFLLNKASKAMGKVKDGKTLEKLVEDKISDSGQSRRDFMSMVGTGGLMAGLKWLGLGGILKGATKVPTTDFTVKLRTQFLNSDVDYGTSGLAYFDISALTSKVKKVLHGFMKNKQATKPGLKGKDYMNIEPGDAKKVIKKLQDAGFKGKITGIVDESGDVLQQAEKAGWKNFVDDFKKSSMRKNIAEHKRYEDFVVYENDPGFMNWNKATKGKLDKPYVSTIDEVVDLLEPVVKKAEGGRIGLDAGGPPISGEELKQMKEEASGPGIMDFLKIKAGGGADEGRYNYGGSFGVGGKFPFMGGEVGITSNLPFGRSSNKFGVGESTLGDQWNIGANITLPIDFNKMLSGKGRRKQANGGLTKTVPPKRGPMPQGLPSALYNGIMRPRSY
jgi:hypothetical protein